MPSIIKTLLITGILIGAYEATAFYLDYDYSIYSIYQKTQQTETEIYISECHYFSNGTEIPENYHINLDSSNPSVIIQFTVYCDAPVRLSSAKYSFVVGTQSIGDLDKPIDTVALGMSHTWTNKYTFTTTISQTEYPVFAGTWLAGFAVILYTPDNYLLMKDIYNIGIVSS